MAVALHEGAAAGLSLGNNPSGGEDGPSDDVVASYDEAAASAAAVVVAAWHEGVAAEALS